ncbi:Gfo/Idh/MocA family protein [Enterococcus sp. DIV0876]|uniref:Gfo/Idh/MocA family protein n=1 Tax=Enterococcus sp. DIV0876 TaxID=2774633 RepID=UPI003D3005A4
MKKYRWGMIGLGDIASQFAAGFDSPNSELYGVSARSLPKVEAFAAQYQIPKAYATTEDLLDDPMIDIVYIAVPNDLHHEFIMKSLLAGKHVLCEKAITTNADALAEELALAKEKQLILEEAMTIFNMPLYAALREQINTGRLGKLKMIQAPFGSYKDPDPTNRFFNPDLGGGALLDIGTYAVSFARFFMSEAPEVTYSDMKPFSTGVDEQSVTILRNPLDEMANVTLTFQAKMPKTGIVAFEEGYITIDEYPRADQAMIHFRDGKTETVAVGDTNQALNYEIDNMLKTIEGKSAGSIHLTTDVINLLDQMQAFWAQQ